ncbi:MAG: ribosomal protein S18-alanine N-acetyltransferase [Roseiflexaceae bacterium]|nr:ribosomal protein S18-alanine N-acetyltransferase [Roseiflexus sp.]MDW8211975.1 ribosomal protein S18-alanine N-acetyltransferase [Roseiflexaceae bacterium]
MTEDDIEQVQMIERASFSTLWSANTYRHELRSPATSRYIVARASPTPPPPRPERPALRRGLLASLIPMFFGQQASTRDFPIVGYGGVWLSVDEGHITTIAVAPAYRGRGIGELLLNGLIDQALDLHADVLTLEVRVSNIVAQQLYLKYGFRPAGTRPRYYTDNGEDALIMWTDPIRSPAYQEKLRQLRERLFARLREEADEPAPLHN